MPTSRCRETDKAQSDKQCSRRRRKAYCYWFHLNRRTLAQSAVTCNKPVGSTAVIVGLDSDVPSVTLYLLGRTTATAAAQP